MYNSPFKWWVQSVMPVVFDDSLSYYEVLAKLTKYIEGLTGDVQEIEKVLETIDGIEDIAEFTKFLETIQAEIGNLNNLQTDSKNNLVNAINEVALKANIAYKKPPSGIPESDLDQSVRDKLNQSGETAEYIINNKTLKKAPNNNSPTDLGLGTYSVPSGGIPWDTLSQDVKDRINAGGSGTGGTTDYTDLINKPQINGHTLNPGNNTIESLGLGTYNKPAGGIPENDLDAEVQEKLNTSGGIADSESTFIATRNYEAGELIYIDGTLYKTKYMILNGTNLIPGNNIEVTDISNEIERINSDIDALKIGSGPDSWSLSATITTDQRQNFFEYFNAIGNENYLFIIDPVAPFRNGIYHGYILRVCKRDGTEVLNQRVLQENANLQQRITFTPVDTGEYYCTLEPTSAGYSSTYRIVLEYTESQGISELWAQVNKASQVEPRVGALETLVDDQQTRVDNLKSALIDANALIGDEIGLTPCPFWEKGGLFTNTNPINTTPSGINTWVHQLIPCSAGDVFNIHIDRGTSQARPYAFLDSAYYILNIATMNIVNATVVAPENSAFLLCNARTDVTPAIHELSKGYGYIKEKANKNTIATIESTNIATHSYSPGQLFFIGDTLYKSTYNISIGDTITAGTNCDVTTVSEISDSLKSFLRSNGIYTNNNTYTDLNEFPLNTFMSFTASAAQNFSNKPSRLSGVFSVLTIGAQTTNYSGALQIIFTPTKENPIAYRTNVSNVWREWKYTEPTELIITVRSDGSGDYTSVVDAIKYTMEHPTTEHSPYIIDIGAGTFDLSSVGTLVENNQIDFRGLFVMPYTHIVGKGKEQTKLQFFYSGNNDTVMSQTSALNCVYEGSLKDLTIECKNIRYTIHADYGLSSEPQGDENEKMINNTFVIENTNLIHYGYDEGLNPTFKRPRVFGLGIRSGIIRKFINTMFYAVADQPWTSHDWANNTKGSQIYFDGCELYSLSESRSLTLISYGSDTKHFVNIKNSVIPNGISLSVNTAQGNPKAVIDYYVQAENIDTPVIESSVNNSNLNRNYYTFGTQSCLNKTGDIIEKNTPVKISGTRKANLTVGIQGIAINRADANEIVNVKTGGYIALETNFSAGTIISYDNGWIEDANGWLMVMSAECCRFIN